MRKTIIAAAIAVASVGASAATITDSFSNPLQTTEISQTGTLDLFNSTLGTLNSVTLSLSGSGITTINLTNTAAQDQSVRATGSVDLFFSTSLAGLDLSAVAISLSFPTGQQSIAPNETKTFPDLADSAGQTLSPLASLFAVSGGGTFTISCDSLSGIGLAGGGGNIQSTQTTRAQCAAEVVYDFTAAPPPPPNRVPEPSLLALAGIAALVGARRLRRSR